MERLCTCFYQRDTCRYGTLRLWKEFDTQIREDDSFRCGAQRRRSCLVKVLFECSRTMDHEPLPLGL